MKRLLFLSIFIIFSFISYSQSYSVKLLVKGMANKNALLTQVEGDMNLILDTLTADEVGMFTTSFNNFTEVGMYKFIFPQYQNAQVPFVFNHEDISLYTNHADFDNAVQVLESAENKILYDFNSIQREFDNNIDVLEYAFSHYTKPLFKLKLEEEYALQLNQYKTNIETLVGAKTSFAAKYIRSTQKVIPLNISSLAEKNAFMKAHYFDNINFADTLLFKTELIPNACISYLGLYAGQFTEQNKTAILKQAVDTILYKTMSFPQTYDYVVDYLLNGFESMGDAELVLYISEAYLQQNSCQANNDKTTMQRKALSNTELAIGTNAPSFSIESLSGVKVQSKDVYKKPTVIVFWASWCGHCMQALPQIMEFYSADSQYNLITVSIDTAKVKVEQIISALPANNSAIHVCDELGWGGAMAQDFYLYATPTILIINKGKIIAKPIELNNYKEELNKLFR